MRPSIWSLVSAAALATVLTACGPKYHNVAYPPRIDLSQHELIGVVHFDDAEQGELGEIAARRFTESARRDQGMVRMVWLEDESRRPSPQRIRELGLEHGLQTLVLGRFDVSDVTPKASISTSLSSGSISASVEATLEVEIVETATGASLWSASATSRKNVGNLRVLMDKTVSFNAVDPESTYGALIDELVSRITGDFRTTWRREPIP